MTTMIFFPFNTVFSPVVPARHQALVVYHKSQIHPRNFGPRTKLRGFQVLSQVRSRQKQESPRWAPAWVLRSIAIAGNTAEKQLKLQRRRSARLTDPNAR